MRIIDISCVLCAAVRLCVFIVFFFQAEDGIRDLVRSRGLGDVYKRQEFWRESKISKVMYQRFWTSTSNQFYREVIARL